MIARLEVTRGDLTEYPLAEKTTGGWQNGVTFYPDDEVTKVTVIEIRRPMRGGGEKPVNEVAKYLDWLPSHIKYVPVSDIRSRLGEY